MAKLIKIDGETLTINPKNKEDFQLEELQGYVGGYIEIVDLRNDEIMVVNENGKFISEMNEVATTIAHSHEALFDTDYICGDVVICKAEEVK